MPIAIVPFASSGGADNGVDVAQIIQGDLEGSGRFKLMQRSAMTSTPSRAQDVQVAVWKSAGNDYVVVGRVSAGELTGVRRAGGLGAAAAGW